MGGNPTRVLVGALAVGSLCCGRSAAAQDTGVIVAEIPTETTEVASEGTEEPVTEKSRDSAADAYGLAYAQRGLVMPKGMVRGTFDLTVGKLFAGTDAITSMSFGVALSVVENLELGFSRYRMGSFPDLNTFPSLGFGGEGLIGFFMTPDGSFGDIPFYARYRLVDAEAVEIAIDFGVLFPTETEWGILAGVPIRFHAGDQVAVDTGAQLWVNDAGGFNILTFGIPLSIVGNITKHGFLKINTGVVILDLSHEVADKPLYAIPFGFGGGFNFEAGSTMLDLFAAFRWPALGAFSDGASDTSADYWTLTFGLNIYSPVLF